MRTLPRFGLLTAAALLAAGGCQGSINNGMTGTGGSNTGTGGSNTGTGGSNTGSGGSNTGTGGSNTGTGGSTTGTGGATEACTPLPPLPRRLWRLSVAQWDAAVQTLLALKTAPLLTS